MYSKLIKKAVTSILVLALTMRSGAIAFADDATSDLQNSTAASQGDTSVSSITTDSVLKGDVPVVYGYGNPSILTVQKPYATEWSYDVLPD